jgi:Putative restriction endonuclease
LSGAPPEKYASLPVLEPHELVKCCILDALIPYVFGNTQHGLASKQTCLAGAPDLAIEVVSPTDLEADLRRKSDAYLDGGSKSVWVVYPEARSVMIYTRDAVRKVRGDQLIEDPASPLPWPRSSSSPRPVSSRL